MNAMQLGCLVTCLVVATLAWSQTIAPINQPTSADAALAADLANGATWPTTTTQTFAILSAGTINGGKGQNHNCNNNDNGNGGNACPASP
jgi:hypothetical protein